LGWNLLLQNEEKSGSTYFHACIHQLFSTTILP
jgi:hypothetical protein